MRIHNRQTATVAATALLAVLIGLVVRIVSSNTITVPIVGLVPDQIILSGALGVAAGLLAYLVITALLRGGE